MRDGEPAAPAQEVENKAGFVLLIEGYSPYEKISELMDPPGVGDDPTRWGVITRFGNLEKFIPGNPFVLYSKGDIKHFKVETGRVDLSKTDMPAGIGIVKEIERVPRELLQPAAGAAGRGAGTPRDEMMGMMGGVAARPLERVTTELVLIDPMTQEEMSRTYDIFTRQDIARNPELTDRDLGRKKLTQFGEERYIERDHWFRIQVKFVWKDAPKPAAPLDGGYGPNTY